MRRRERKEVRKKKKKSVQDFKRAKEKKERLGQDNQLIRVDLSESIHSFHTFNIYI